MKKEKPYDELQSDHGDEPKGRRGQEHDHRQPRHRACPAEQAGAAHRRRCTRLFDPLPRLPEATE